MNRIRPGSIVLLFFICLFCFGAKGYAQETVDAKRIAAITSAVIKKAYPACVRLWGFDTIKKAQNSAQFTGVVVTAEGHILTAAHAIVPGKIYLVNFPDGRTALAEGMGRMASESQGRPDVAMLKIKTKGAWPHAEMGWSSSLKLNSMCISIAYPTTLNQKLPSVRFGRISRLTDIWGFLVSTCIMEPGDSGGPLFDELGRVIALHSRIDVDEKINYEVPVDLYRKYWTALNEVEDYKSLPSKEDQFEPDPMQALIRPGAGLENLDQQWSKALPGFNGSCLKISSSLKGKPQQIYGTVFWVDAKKSGAEFKGGSFLLSKSSLVAEAISVELTTGEAIPATVVARDKAQDLVLLYVPVKLTPAIKMVALGETAAIPVSDLGKFLLSKLPGGQHKLSVLGSAYFALDKKFSSGYFGASATFIDKKITLTRIAPGSPAETAGLLLQDQITEINSVPIALPPAYSKELMKYEPGDTVLVRGIRNSEPFTLAVVLGSMPMSSRHPADYFAGGKSLRRDGFDKVFTHDALLKPEECGSPVFDINGKFYGMNIARFSRTSCLVLPADVLYQFVLRSFVKNKN